MNQSIELLDTIYLPFIQITPTIWRDGDMCGLANIYIRPSAGPIGWLLMKTISRRHG